jgi:hypothetical protein
MELARSYRLMKKFPEADAIMKSALGDPKTKSKGWARSLEFQKEAIYLLEEKASAMPADPKDAKMKAWIEAKNAWEDLAGGYVSALSLPVRKEGEPESKKPNDKTISEDERNLLIPVYADILADYRRCMIKAYSQLLPDAAKLNAKLAEMAGSFLEIEKEYGEKIKDEPKAKFIDLLNDNPAIKAEYKKLGGKMFLDGK